MTIKAQLKDDMKSAMRAKETVRLGAIRMLMAAVKQREVDERIELDDAQILALVEKLIKQRRDSAQQFRDADRPELAEKEEEEIKVLTVYLPEQLSDEEIDAIIEEAVQALQPTQKDMGKMVGYVRPKVQGKADMAAVSGKIKDRLSQLG